MKRKHKQYSKPKRPFEKERITEEDQIKKEFGLKNKKEIWKSESQIKKIREKAKKLISASPEEQKSLFDRLKKIGINVNSIADILSLDKKDYLKRRLQTLVVEKNIATTAKGARQLITHKKIMVNGRVVDSPSYIVPTEFEDKITLKQKEKKPKAEEPEKSISENTENADEENGENESLNNAENEKQEMEVAA